MTKTWIARTTEVWRDLIPGLSVALALESVEKVAVKLGIMEFLSHTVQT